MDARKTTLDELNNRAANLSGRSALLGFDGFVDRIVHPVAQRHGQGNRFTPMKTIEEFGKRVLGAVGKSTNIELSLQKEKIGGNGPIMANALLALGPDVRYLGALGKPAVHPVFTEFAARTKAVSFAEPGVTTALEFTDGKLLLGTMSGLDEVTYENLLQTMGEGAFHDAISRADLVALVNWTMIPNMTAFLTRLLEKVFMAQPPRDQRSFFFDLADPEKRSRGDLVTALRTMARFQAHGRATLGFNLKEAQQVVAALDLGDYPESPDGLREMATRIRQELNVGTVVIHPKESAACATRDDCWWVEGPYTENPVITTGAGDHFNAGFAAGQLLELSPPACLMLGVSCSGYYVRSGESPSLNDLEAFVRNG
ncbi:MAG: carbohydrate kinase family protein [Puniceicoccaceae bacterium]|nr:MAG: carbohydrate kinase family protein [Puniceicoccaceae bacterium]